MLAKTSVVLLLFFIECITVEINCLICKTTGICHEINSKCKNDLLQACFPDSESFFHHTKYLSNEPSGEQESSDIAAPSHEACFGPERLTNISLLKIRLDYFSINPDYFSICVAWNLTEYSGHYGGYEVRVIGKYNNIVYRYCIRNPYQTHICINKFRYDEIPTYAAIEVLPYPVASDDNEQLHKKSRDLRADIEGCADIHHNGTICSMKQYQAPRNVVVTSAICNDYTKEINITWNHPANTYAVPMAYYIYIYNESKKEIIHILKVTNSLQIQLHNLSANYRYLVRIQAYHNCSGLGDYGTTGSHRFGCGKIKEQKEVYNQEFACQFVEESSTVSSQFDKTFTTNVPFSQIAANVDIVLFSSLFCTIIVVIGTATLAIFTLFLVLKYCKKKISSFVYPQRTPRKVFVFCSPSMSQASLEHVQKHIIRSLLDYFDIITPSDIDSGNISMWLEDSMNSVDSILIVGNKDLCQDWEKEERSPLLNSLELLVSAAASQNTIGKFCFISDADSTSDVSVPNNSYLKLMPVFLMGQKKFEIEKLYHFVTKSRGIEFSNET